jgi:hypothetical protein
MPGGYIAIAVGAFLDFAVKAHRVVLGINFHTLGAILIIVGSLSVIVPLLSSMGLGSRRQRTIIEDDVRYVRGDDGGYGLRRGDIIESPATGSRASRR